MLEYWSSDGTLRWKAAVTDIVMMAEFTTDEGPYLDDYFLVFVTIENSKKYFATASFYADGSDEIIRQLAEQWTVDIELRLFNSTDWKSRVIWPPALAGKEYFEFREIQPNSLLAKLRKVAFGPVYEYFPCDSVRLFLNSKS